MLTDQTILDRHLILLEERSFMKWSKYATTDIMDAQECSNISSNGKEAPKATTLGNLLIKFSPQTYSGNIINIDRSLG